MRNPRSNAFKPQSFQSWEERHRQRLRRAFWRSFFQALFWTLLGGAFVLGFMSIAHATWKPEYAQADQATKDWYEKAEIMPAARPRLNNWSSCCAHSDVVKTQFRVDKSSGADEWYWLDGTTWKLIPADIIHWGERAPDGQPTLFAAGEVPTCFYPGDGGI